MQGLGRVCRLGDIPRCGKLSTFLRARYVVLYLQASKAERRGKEAGGVPCANDYTGRKGKESSPAKAAAAEAAKRKELHSLDRTEVEANLQGPEKLEKRFPVAGLELFKFLGDLLGLAFMAKNGVEQGDRGAVVHQTRVQAHTP